MKKLFLVFVIICGELNQGALAQVFTFEQSTQLQEARKNLSDAKALDQKGEYAKAIPLYERALAICEKTLGPEHSDTVATLRYLAEDYQSTNEYAKALPLFERDLVFCEKTLGPEHMGTVRALKSLANLYQNTGNYEKALPLYERSLAICEKAQGHEHSDTAVVLRYLACGIAAMGNYEKALPLYERSLAICEKNLGPEHLQTAICLRWLAFDITAMGNYEKALPLYERSLAIFEKNLGREHPETARSLNNLANNLADHGNYEKALPLHERALAICEKKLGPENLETSRSLNNLADDLAGMGNYEKALPLYERALAICEKKLGPEHRETASSLNNLADDLAAMGNYGKALPLIERALAITDKVLGPEHPNTLNSCFQLASVQYNLGMDLPVIRTSLARFYSGREKSMEGILTMDEDTRLSYQKKNLKFPLIDLLRGEQRCQLILRTKGIILDSLLEDQAALKKFGSNSPEANEVSYARFQIGKLAFSNKKEDQEEVARLKARIDAILTSAAGQRAKVGRVRGASTITPDAVASSLLQGSMLVEFVQFKNPKIKGDAARCYGALLLGQDGDSKFVRIDDAVGIDSSARILRESIAKGDEKALADQQKHLSEKLWTPVANNLPEGTKKLFIGADGQLNFLSFAALPAPDGRFLAEHYDIAYVGCGRDLARKVTPSDSQSIALFADPVFDRGIKRFSTNALALRSGEVDAFGKIVLPPLPGTKAEESAVEKVAKSAGWSPEARLGEEANKSAIKDLKSPGILHLATHGFYLNTLPENGAEGVRGMKVMEAPELLGSKTEPLPKIDPMHASGIALTGAQSTLKAWSEGRVPNPSEDGILTAEEVGALNLEGTWLVTLSACETGVGDARTGEGVFGLRRAFMMAGAQNLLMTLWPVSDEVTPKIMADFYKEAFATHDAAASLAKVQRDWLVKLRKEKGLLAAVRDAGPFAMVVMANPNAKP